MTPLTLDPCRSHHYQLVIVAGIATVNVIVTVRRQHLHRLHVVIVVIIAIKSSSSSSSS